MRKENTNHLFKKRLKSTIPQIGTFVKIFSPEIIEILGMAGIDFIVIDMEHTTLEFHQVEQMVRTADLHGMSTIIRIPDSSRSSILRALDLGATGIQVPQIDNEDDVAKVVDKAKYPPTGSRGATFAHRSARFGYNSMNYFQDANESSIVVVHVETESAYSKVEQISKVEGLDVVFIGPLDLSISLGTEADYIHGELATPVKNILKACRQHGKTVGIAVTNAEQYQFAIQEQIPYIVWLSDIALFKQAADNVTQAVNRVRS